MNGQKTPEVHITMSATINNGDMNFAKYTVGLTMPCDGEDGIDPTYQSMKEWCEANLQELVTEHMEANEGSSMAQPGSAVEANLDEEL